MVLLQGSVREIVRVAVLAMVLVMVRSVVVASDVSAVASLET